MPGEELREAIEAAVVEVEKATPATPAPISAPASSPAPAPTSAPAPEGEEKPEPTAAPVAAKDTKDEPGQKKGPSEAPKPLEDAAPKAWKGTVKAKWSALDPEVRAEIHRRETEITRAFGENSQTREFHKAFNETVRPYEARYRSLGMTPVQMVGELLKADYLLATAPTHQRASFMASLIKDYGIDIKALDSALSGEEPDDPVAARVEQMLTQKLQPIQQFLAGQNRQVEQQTLTLQQEAQTTIEQMATNVAKFPHFEEVRNDMADLIEIMAQRGTYITPAQAYDRAVMMNPELQAQEVARRTAEAHKTAASASNAKAQQALNASVSVSSSPAGVPTKGNGAGSLRDDLEAAIANVEGR